MFKELVIEKREKYNDVMIDLMIEIEKRYEDLTKTERIRLENWVLLFIQLFN